MKAKFKVGDKVIAKNGAPYGITTNGWKGTVVGTRQNPNGHFIIPGDDIEVKDNNTSLIYSVLSKYFDLVPECNQKIVITTNGKTTLARLYDGDKAVKTAEAKCNPSDEFNFETGAKLAFERLFEEKPKFKAGDRVKIIGNTGVYHYYEIGDVVTVKRVKHNGNLECRKSNGHFQCVSPIDVELVSFDWDAFKAGKICVKATDDNFKDFVAEAKKYGLKFEYNEKFNPFDNVCDFAFRAFMKTDVKENEIYVLCEDGYLRLSHFRESEEFVW